ncbi:MAG TPA: hypothetical protein VNQ52_01215 [Microbacteriaceae bacterium]|nr:hypothetical protein [Microbacteriaceae bacterium]
MTEFCSGVGRIVSAVWNADIGYLDYGVTAEGWSERMVSALGHAQRLVTATSGDQRAAGQRLLDAVSAASAPPQDAGNPENIGAVMPILRQINGGVGGCVDNGTEVAILAEWGG